MAAAAASSQRPEIVELVYNHIVLPRKLPGKHDGQLSANVEENLVRRLLDACRVINKETDGKYFHQWELTRRVLQSACSINTRGTVNKSTLLFELRSLEKNYCLIVHVTEQNCALLIRRYFE